MATNYTPKNRAGLEIHKVLEAKCNTFRIISTTSGNQFNLRGFIQSGFSISGGNEYSEELSYDLGGAAQKMLGGASMRQAQAGLGSLDKNGAMVSSGLLNTSARGNVNTLKSYNGSHMPSFSFTWLFVATNAAHNVLDDVTVLMSMVLPRITTSTVMLNPLGYVPREDKTDFSDINDNKLDEIENFVPKSGDDSKQVPLAGEGTLNIMYGSYFLATGMVCRSFSAELSEDVSFPYPISDQVRAGTGVNLPLYALCTATFEPKRLPSILEYRRYFRGIRDGFEKQKGFEDNAVINAAQLLDRTAFATSDALLANIVNPLNTFLGGFANTGIGGINSVFDFLSGKVALK